MEIHRRLSVLYTALFFLSASFFRSKAASCREGFSGCPTQVSTAETISPTLAPTFTYKMTQHISGAKAVDMVLVISAVFSVSNYHLWLQTAVPLLEKTLKSLNIGVEPSSPNRYAVVQFGVRGSRSPSIYINISGDFFFTSGSFVTARRQLQRDGLNGDGYEAIEYALQNAPFRNKTGIAKMMHLVANRERSTFVTQSDLTKSNISQLLRVNDILFDATVGGSLSITTSTANISVLGLSGYESGIVPGSNGSYEIIIGEITPAIDTTSRSLFHDYVTLALDSGGVACSLNQLVSRNVTVIDSFVGLLVSGHSLHALRQVEVCEKCWCSDEGVNNCADMICETARDQDSLAHCNRLQPTPALPSLPTSPTRTVVLRVAGSVVVFPGGDVQATFTSNRNRATYNCVMLDGSTPTPEIKSCTSPYYAKNLTEGRHKLLVIAKRKGFYGSRVFEFDIRSEEAPESPLELSLSENSELVNGSISVNMMVTGAVMMGASQVQLKCSMGGNAFFPCTSPHNVTTDDIPMGGLLFVVVAFTGNRSAAIAIKMLQKPIFPSGPVKIIVLAPQSPDPLGRITIRFRTSRPDVHCVCQVNMSRIDCTDQYLADPRILGAGTHNLTIICMDYSGFVDTQHFKLTLLPPPQSQVPGPLACNLTLNSQITFGTIFAVFSCDRQIFATCQVSGMAAEPCNSPYGRYGIDVRQLSRGPHLFILNMDDGFGRTLMKVHPFNLGTVCADSAPDKTTYLEQAVASLVVVVKDSPGAHRRCCPMLDNQLSSLTRLDNLTNVLLDLRMSAGNCSDNEGFSYTIDWGDGFIQTGSILHINPITASNFFPSISSAHQNSGNSTSSHLSGAHAVNVTFCNNPVSMANKCCNELTFPIKL